MNNRVEITIPGDKSISHRAVMLGSLATGVSKFRNFLFSEDCIHTINIFHTLGVRIETDEKTGSVAVNGVGLNGLKKPDRVLDVGNSGTGIRLITGILAGQAFDSQITGDASIQNRPMRRIIEPLTRMGAVIKGCEISGRKGVFPPLSIHGSQTITNITYTLPVASAQVKSAVLFASLFSEQPTTIIEPHSSRDHTERFLKVFGADIAKQDWDNVFKKNNTMSCSGKNTLKAPDKELFIPSDISSAVFFIVLACLAKDSSREFVFKHIGLNPTRAQILNVLGQMGADIEIRNKKGEDFEPYGDIIVKPLYDLNNQAGAGNKERGIQKGEALPRYKNIEIDPKLIPFIIDEIPILAVAGMFGEGRFKVTGAKELRVKESDRIRSICEMLRAFGAEVIEFEYGFEFIGPVKFKEKCEIKSYGDHRIAMSAMIAAAAAGVSVSTDQKSISTSFPNFGQILGNFKI
ncbi:3-phosphoshikimate 1-carboxyvinyltransferase [Thermoproteota archaeon]